MEESIKETNEIKAAAAPKKTAAKNCRPRLNELQVIIIINIQRRI